MSGEPLVIIWTPVGRDALLASSALSQAGIRGQRCTSLEDVCLGISRPDAGLLVVAGEALSAEAIEQLRQTLHEQPAWSDLPIVLLTGGGGLPPFTPPVINTNLSNSFHRL